MVFVRFANIVSPHLPELNMTPLMFMSNSSTIGPIKRGLKASALHLEGSSYAESFENRVAFHCRHCVARCRREHRSTRYSLVRSDEPEHVVDARHRSRSAVFTVFHIKVFSKMVGSTRIVSLATLRIKSPSGVSSMPPVTS